MSMVKVRMVTAVACFALAACSTMRPAALASASASDKQSSVKVDDTVRVGTATGLRRELLVTRVDSTVLEGIDVATREKLSIAASEVTSLERKEIDGGRTTLLVVGIVLGLAVWGLVAAKGVVKDALGTAAAPR